MTINEKALTQLVYGKFNAQSISYTRSDWPEPFTAVEIDLIEYLSWNLKETKRFQSWIGEKNLKIIARIRLQKNRSHEEYEEIIQIWYELYSYQTLYLAVYSGKKEWSCDQHLNEIKKLPKKYNYYFEWGKSDSTFSVQFMRSLRFFHGFVLDPDWQRSSFKSLRGVPLHFKIHGWNQERWFRRYGPIKATQILKSLNLYSESYLTLSYSGKASEAQLFIKQ